MSAHQQHASFFWKGLKIQRVSSLPQITFSYTDFIFHLAWEQNHGWYQQPQVNPHKGAEISSFCCTVNAGLKCRNISLLEFNWMMEFYPMSAEHCSEIILWCMCTLSNSMFMPVYYKARMLLFLPKSSGAYGGPAWDHIVLLSLGNDRELSWADRPGRWGRQ